MGANWCNWSLIDNEIPSILLKLLKRITLKIQQSKIICYLSFFYIFSDILGIVQKILYCTLKDLQDVLENIKVQLTIHLTYEYIFLSLSLTHQGLMSPSQIFKAIKLLKRNFYNTSFSKTIKTSFNLQFLFCNKAFNHLPPFLFSILKYLINN